MAAIKGILFDKDGTLIDFEQSFAAATLNVMRDLANGDEALIAAMAESVDFDHQAMVFARNSIVIAGTGAEIAACFAPHLGEIPSKGLEERVDRLFAVHTLQNLVPFAGVAEVLLQLHQEGYWLGIATNDAEQNAREQVQKIGIDKLFSFIAGYDSGHGPKPEAGMVGAFCTRAGLPPNQVMMVGDSLHDMEAGKRAGAVKVAVTSGPATHEELLPHADHVIAGVGELPNLLARLQPRG